MGRTTLVWAIAAAVAADASVALAQSSKLDRTRIEEITGLKGTFIEAEGVFKVTSPRTDIEGRRSTAGRCRRSWA